MSGVRIPADVDRPDRLVANLTARQVVILAVSGIALYGAWTATGDLVPPPVFWLVALPVGAVATILALGQRDGISLDRWVGAAIAHRLAPRWRVAAPEGIRPAPDWLTTRAHAVADADGPPGQPAPLRLPAETVTETGVVDLGGDGLALVAVASTVNFALRTPAEQDSLVAAFGRYLHSLTAPVQILVRTHRLDLSGPVTELRQRAGALPHPALEAAAREHADYLTDLGTATDLLRRQVLLVLRDDPHPPGSTTATGSASPLGALVTARGWRRHTSRREHLATAARRAAESRLLGRLHDAVDLLAPAGITVSVLDAGGASAVLGTACAPDTLVPPSTALAAADDVVTVTAQPWDTETGRLPADGDPAEAGTDDRGLDRDLLAEAAEWKVGRR